MIYVTGDTHGCPERLSENNIRAINKKYNIDFPVPGSGDTLIIPSGSLVISIKI